ncbi:KAP family P-loop NTPase fold protein [Sessilibacter corallicola]|uniref:KAP NTPase domain-containing protein n=1 Tax=Sessilibacter corallicola TaxID=2904075 RepID=A0ABQ0A918_9GAMM
MKVKPNDIAIPTDNPFSNDLLERKSEIENLSAILSNMDGPLVLAIDSPWGTGKTTFINLWRVFLESEDNVSIYFNAWESDYADDPLVALVSELDKWVMSNDDSRGRKGVWKKAKSLLPAIAKSTIISATKAATFGGLDIEKEYEKIAADLAGSVASDLVDSFDIQTEAISSFKQKIEQTLSLLGESQKNIIVFVDELDRCRPTYAIELLERIKHLFNIERLVFVLSTDVEQLSHSICAVYGNGFDSKKYLQRFIDLDYTLKKPENKSYIASLFNSLTVSDYFLKRREGRYELEHLIDCCVILADRFQLSLREINLLAVRIKLILLSVPTNHYLDEPLILSLLMVREHNPELYSRYIVDPSVADEVIEYIGLNLPNEKKYSFPFCLMAGFLISPNMAASEGTRFKELLVPYEDILSNEKYQHNDIWYAADYIIDVAKKTRDMGRTLSHKTTVERIELLHRINIEV